MEIINGQKCADKYVGLRAKGWTSVGCCERCGKPLTDSIQLELDQRVNEYHDFGSVPPDYSQGWFDFGPDCAAIMRKRARAALDGLANELHEVE